MIGDKSQKTTSTKASKNIKIPLKDLTLLLKILIHDAAIKAATAGLIPAKACVTAGKSSSLCAFANKVMMITDGHKRRL